MKTPYSMPTRITFGDGSISVLPDLRCVREAKTVALYIGGGSLKKSGHLDEILALLKGKKVRLTENIPPNPGVTDLIRETEKLRKDPCDCIIAVGGGSVMDLGKSVGLAAVQTPSIVEMLKELPKDPKRGIPVVTVPTTSGTGAEVTPFAVFWDMQNKQKYSFGHYFLYPEEAVLDPLLTYSMPPEVTATTGMDAFTQAAEAYWNNNSNPVSDGFALLALPRILQWLPEAVKNGANAEARLEMLLGNLQTGLAFSNTRTAACHSISYPMTLHFGVVHGQAVGVTLPEVILLNAKAQPDRVPAFCKAMDCKTIEEAAEKIRNLLKASGLKTRLSELGISKDGIDIIVQGGFTPGRMGNNPFPFTAETMRTMLEGIL